MKDGEKRRLQQLHSQDARPRDVEMEFFSWCQALPSHRKHWGARQGPGFSIPKYIIEIQKLSHNFVQKKKKKKIPKRRQKSPQTNKLTSWKQLLKCWPAWAASSTSCMEYDLQHCCQQLLKLISSIIFMFEQLQDIATTFSETTCYCNSFIHHPSSMHFLRKIKSSILLHRKTH